MPDIPKNLAHRSAVTDRRPDGAWEAHHNLLIVRYPRRPHLDRHDFGQYPAKPLHMYLSDERYLRLQRLALRSMASGDLSRYLRILRSMMPLRR